MNKEDLEERDINGQTPLHVAAKLGFLQAIEYVSLTICFSSFPFSK